MSFGPKNRLFRKCPRPSGIWQALYDPGKRCTPPRQCTQFGVTKPAPGARSLAALVSGNIPTNLPGLSLPCCGDGQRCGAYLHEYRCHPVTAQSGVGLRNLPIDGKVSGSGGGVPTAGRACVACDDACVCDYTDTGRWGRGGKRNSRAQQGAAALDALLSELGPAGLSEALCSSAVLENLVACVVGAPPSPLEQTLLKGVFSVTLAASPQVRSVGRRSSQGT